MKNKFTLLFVGSILLFLVLGCSSLNPFSSDEAANADPNRTITDDAVDVTVGNETTGIPECDEVFTFIAAEINDPDANFITKSIWQTAMNRFKEQVRVAGEKSEKDRENLAKWCKDFGENLKKNKAEEQQKGN